MEVGIPYRDIDSPLPALFELIAKETVQDSLGAIFRYCLVAMVNRVPFLHHVPQRAEDLYILLKGTLDIAYISVYDATFLEHFLGLRRCPHSGNPLTERSTSGALSWGRKRSSMVEIVLMAVWRKILMGFKTSMPVDGDSQGRIQQLRKIIHRCIPYFHAISVLSGLLLSIAYTQRRVSTISPWLWAQSLMLVHASTSDMQRYAKKVLNARLRIVVILLAILTKVSEWYFGISPSVSSGSETEVLPIREKSFSIPPPPEVQSLKPTLRDRCPLCDRKITNQTLNVASGRLFCYPCIRRHIESEGKCPVTGIPTTVTQLRRMYVSE
ncbi:hypothetical protein XU18_1819 [Perkinsela sp. CCAP 1560/4]|nr:hypothetical protein XU18_1819 [Perkinsela sp. CCAP 1560/4]|eukprot:KNH07287.1 hypothetical protein XU18_1819 [Perkinsela sp. CCAP 1560/4]